ncbi:MAG: hypothetical protein J7L44_01595 [Candidatus Diapherotrites archaeon]|nr:hypothetical protein [Candidatus Diapherotrites archaeon]
MEIFEGKETPGSLSKGWQQFILGTIIFYILYFALLASSFANAVQSILTTGTITLNHSDFVINAAYCFGATFFIVVFIKRYNEASPSRLGFVISVVGAILILFAFATLYELSPIIKDALGEHTLYTIGKPNIVKTLGSMVFYYVVGFFLVAKGNKLNEGKTPFAGVLAILILPIVLLAMVFTFGLIVQDIVMAVLLGAGKLKLTNIAANLILLAIFSSISLVLFRMFLNSDFREPIFRLQSTALRIAGAGYAGLFFLALLGFSNLLLVDFGHMEVLKALAIVFGWLIPTVFYGFMVFVLFKLSGFIEQIGKKGLEIRVGQETVVRPEKTSLPQLTEEELRKELKSILEEQKEPAHKVERAQRLTEREEKSVERMVSFLKKQRMEYKKDVLEKVLLKEGFPRKIVDEIIRRMGLDK